MKRLIKAAVLSLSALVLLGAAAPAPAYADTAGDIKAGVNQAAGGADTSSAGDNLGSTIRTVVNILSMVIGIIAVIMIIIAGLNYITSGGNDQKIATAKNTILYAVIGLVIVAFAQVIVRFTVNAVNGGKGVTGAAGTVGGSSDSGSSGTTIQPIKKAPASID